MEIKDVKSSVNEEIHVFKDQRTGSRFRHVCRVCGKLDTDPVHEEKNPSTQRSENATHSTVEVAPTLGRWHVFSESGIRYIRASNNQIVSTAHSMLNGIDNTAKELEADANARLIASAPSLYAALKAVEFEAEPEDEGFCESGCNKWAQMLLVKESSGAYRWQHDADCWFGKVRAALALAEKG